MESMLLAGCGHAETHDLALRMAACVAFDLFWTVALGATAWRTPLASQMWQCLPNSFAALPGDGHVNMSGF